MDTDLFIVLVCGDRSFPFKVTFQPTKSSPRASPYKDFAGRVIKLLAVPARCLNSKSFGEALGDEKIYKDVFSLTIVILLQLTCWRRLASTAKARRDSRLKGTLAVTDRGRAMLTREIITRG